ncbi:hypothetical protein MRB53_035321 [Persea americana]|uniref:Uncharacterized protein n=1 Tax=Persea americana TaxID=3435 RepID=A0ACC2K4D0_PERAE|nr:hypothetical protein MRB53_035321 [Persea americana]
MDPSELRYLEDEDTPTMKTIKGATTGFVAGTIWGTVVATCFRSFHQIYNIPRFRRAQPSKFALAAILVPCPNSL